MKQLSKQTESNAKTNLTFALCTVLALSLAPMSADDYKDKSQGAPGAASSGKFSHNDEKFIRDAAKGGMMEVQMGKLAVQKAQSEQVKQYAQRLVDEHTKANTELRQIASSKGITLPEADRPATATDSADRTQVREKTDADAGAHKEHQEAQKKLEGLSGAEFDRAFIKAALTHHEKDVKEFEKAATSSEDLRLKSFAAKTLPTLREHLSQAKSLQAQVGGIGAPGADSGTDAGQEKPAKEAK